MAENLRQIPVVEIERDGHGQRTIVSKNLLTGELLGEVACATPETTVAAVQRARAAQRLWADRPIEERAQLLREIQRGLYRHFEEIVELLVAEQGKIRHEATVEILPQLEMAGFYARNAKKILKPRRVFARLTPHRRHLVEQRPYGVVLVISPWNFPVFLALTPVITALVAGNAVILKPSEFVTQIAELLGRIVHEAGVPTDVFQVVHGYGDTGAALIEARPDAICFTGSESTGRKIAAKAGELLIPVILELGGKDAAIVLEDADIERTARGLVWAGTINAGQACLSIERVYVMRPVAERLIQAMKTAMDQYVVPGPATNPRATYGLITTEAQRRIIEKHVAEAAAHHARIITGRNQGGNRCYPPTIITDVAEDLAIVTEETFGPVMVVIPVDSEEEAIQKANSSRFGLTASIWTENPERGRRVSRHLEAGVISVNDPLWSANTPEMPWGGVKASGYGRTRGREGLLAMTAPVSISEEWVRLPFEPFWLPYTKLKNSLVRRFIHLWYGPTWRDKLKAFGLKP